MKKKNALERNFNLWLLTLVCISCRGWQQPNMTHEGARPSGAEVGNQKRGHNRGLDMPKASHRQADWQRKENKTMKEEEKKKVKSKGTLWLSELDTSSDCPIVSLCRLILKHHLSFSEGRNAVGQWPTLWPTLFEFQHHYTFIRAAAPRKTARRRTDRQREGDGGRVGPLKRKRNQTLRGRRGGGWPEGEEAVIWDLFNLEWGWCTHVTVYVTKTFLDQSRVRRHSHCNQRPCSVPISFSITLFFLFFLKGCSRQLSKCVTWSWHWCDPHVQENISKRGHGGNRRERIQIHFYVFLCSRSRQMLRQRMGRRQMKKRKMYIEAMAICGATAAPSVEKEYVDAEWKVEGVTGS